MAPAAVKQTNSFVNVKNVRDESQIASGRLLQVRVRGPAKANDMMSECAVRGAWTLGGQNSARYSGARPLTQ